MNFTITDEIRKAIERDTGISYWRLSIMSDEIIVRYVRKKQVKMLFGLRREGLEHQNI